MNDTYTLFLNRQLQQNHIQKIQQQEINNLPKIIDVEIKTQQNIYKKIQNLQEDIIKELKKEQDDLEIQIQKNQNYLLQQEQEIKILKEKEGRLKDISEEDKNILTNYISEINEKYKNQKLRLNEYDQISQEYIRQFQYDIQELSKDYKNLLEVQINQYEKFKKNNSTLDYYLLLQKPYQSKQLMQYSSLLKEYLSEIKIRILKFKTLLNPILQILQLSPPPRVPLLLPPVQPLPSPIIPSLPKLHTISNFNFFKDRYRYPKYKNTDFVVKYSGLDFLLYNPLLSNLIQLKEIFKSALPDIESLGNLYDLEHEKRKEIIYKFDGLYFFCKVFRYRMNEGRNDQKECFNIKLSNGRFVYLIDNFKTKEKNKFNHQTPGWDLLDPFDVYEQIDIIIEWCRKKFNSRIDIEIFHNYKEERVDIKIFKKNENLNLKGDFFNITFENGSPKINDQRNNWFFGYL